MATLAIRGHATRGSEVIGLLEMLGGDNFYGNDGNDELFYYCIRNGKIVYQHYSVLNRHVYHPFTLEEFLEKYPYKVGDKVSYIRGMGEIVSMRWNPVGNEIVYDVKVDKKTWRTTSEFLLRYKDKETMEEKKTPKTQEEVNDYLLQHSVKNAMNLLDIEKCLNDDGLGLPNGVMIKSDGIGSIEFIRWYEKPQYPKTYGECCKVLGVSSNNILTWVKPEDEQKYDYEKRGLLNVFRALLCCRDAYWKVAGDWKPSNCQIVYGISRCSGEIKKIDDLFGGNMVLEFPTEEMRNAFYENFKELIEECKELL